MTKETANSGTDGLGELSADDLTAVVGGSALSIAFAMHPQDSMTPQDPIRQAWPSDPIRQVAFLMMW
jgi:hypothetical protein